MSYGYFIKYSAEFLYSSSQKILKEHPTQPLSFTFVPVVRKLPTQAYANASIHSGKCGQPKCKPNEHLGTQEEATSDMTMLQDGIFKAKIVFIGDSDDEGEAAPVHPHCLEQTNDIARIEPQLQQYKIKSSYKAYAAIPSNTLLLEQKAINREVDNPVYSPVDDKIMSETHAEICSPAQLRPMRRSHSAPISLQKLMDSDAPKNFTMLPRSAGRETKYASFHLLQSGFAEKQLTKPGVIRPVAVIPKFPEEREEYQPNPFRHYLEETSDAELQQPQHPIVTIHENEALSSKELNNTVRGLSKTDATRCPGIPKMRLQDTTDGHSHGLLQITEEEDEKVNKSFTGMITSPRTISSSINSAAVKMVRETSI
ncbi:uncharacterized protein LOC117402643 isoform X3 [Acipenser ruthenus]|uniref:uncharacterized protein LOC117402643 isoform X3 n=1 Tax=Acipenser ruthenus TaxID=7906 RepID=UPI00145AD1E2|nr:uncharacterized protein LOC117402643 isoform X3 [Acipenser ruthenus]